MFSTEAARRRLRNVAVVGAAAAAILTGAASPAHAYSQDVIGHNNDFPFMHFYKNYSSPTNSSLIAYVSVSGTRYQITQRAGSGNGTTNACVRNAGWLPDGGYNNSDSDSNSHFSFYNKTWGNTVVRGWVWDLGNKKCSNGTLRTELFVHSEGTSGWNNNNYKSEGCIKINQTDRSHLASMWNSAYDKAGGALLVS
jgi:hypothetical protein